MQGRDAGITPRLPHGSNRIAGLLETPGHPTVQVPSSFPMNHSRPFSHLKNHEMLEQRLAALHAVNRRRPVSRMNTSGSEYSVLRHWVANTYWKSTVSLDEEYSDMFFVLDIVRRERTALGVRTHLKHCPIPFMHPCPGPVTVPS